MSHPGGVRFMGPVAEEIAGLAMAAGAAGIVAPATRPERVKRLRAVVGRGLILAPGVGAQGGSASEAISNGADFVIAGRSLYRYQNPREAARALAEEIASVPA
jgi:orotidine-5'-phosphate decarboxylase